MKNNLTEKDIDNLYNWAKEYNIKELQTKDRNKLLKLEEVRIDCEENIPNEFFKLTNLKSLKIICGKEIKKLPKEIGNLTNLKRLDIYEILPFFSNDLESIPKEIGNLTKLQYLKVECDIE